MTQNALDFSEDSKAMAILGAAFDVFLQYGFRRTSMEDIAQSAGVSRPALYQHFRNKEDIARSMVQVYYDKSLAALSEALSKDGPPEQVLEAAFLALMGQIKEDLLNAPHASEFLEMSGSVAADLIAVGNGNKAACLAQWLLAQSNAGQVVLSAPADVLAQTMLAAVEGAKTTPFAQYRVRLQALAHLFGRGLRPD